MKGTWTLNKILMVAVVIIVIVNVIVLVTFLVRRSGGIGGHSYALSLTQPVNFITGKVISGGGKSFVIVYTKPSVGLQNEELQFTINTTERTMVNKTTELVPYTFLQQNTLNNAQIGTTADIAVGSIVTVYSESDLRQLGGDTFTASSITILPENAIISGIVQSIAGSSVVVKGFLQKTLNTGMSGTVPKESLYTVGTSSTTEIVMMPSLTDDAGSLPQKRATSDIKPNDIVMVYIQPGATSSSVTALLVQIQPQLIMPTVSISQSSPSATVSSPTPVPARNN